MKVLPALALLVIVTGGCAAPTAPSTREGSETTKDDPATSTPPRATTTDLPGGGGQAKTPSDVAEPVVDRSKGSASGAGPAAPGTAVLRWNSLPTFRYALSVRTTTNGWMLCRDGDAVGTGPSLTFDGSCPSANVKVAVDLVDAFRLHYSNDGSTGTFVERPFSGEPVEFALPSPPSAVALSWSRKSATAEYSLDLVAADGTFIGPCVNAITLVRNLEYTFDGVCTDSGRRFDVVAVRTFRICWAENGDWAHAGCASVHYDGLQPRLTIPN